MKNFIQTTNFKELLILGAGGLFAPSIVVIIHFAYARQHLLTGVSAITSFALLTILIRALGQTSHKNRQDKEDPSGFAE